MVRSVPILGQQDMVELPHQLVDDGHHLVAPFHRQGASGAEIVLHIDDDQRFSGHGRLPKSKSRALLQAVRAASTPHARVFLREHAHDDARGLLLNPRRFKHSNRKARRRGGCRRNDPPVAHRLRLIAVMRRTLIGFYCLQIVQPV